MALFYWKHHKHPQKDYDILTMGNTEKIEFLQKRLLFLNTCLAGFMQIGDVSEVERHHIMIDQAQTELSELIKIEENADR